MAHKILIIDDDPLIIQVVESRLKANGYDVISATDGQEGLKMARADNPALIILDVMLPKMDGFRVAQFLKHDDQYRHIPIIMFTSRIQEADKQTGLETGVEFYMPKSFEPQVLLTKIKELIDRTPSPSE